MPEDRRPVDDAELTHHSHDPRPAAHPANRRRPFRAERRPHVHPVKILQRRLRRIATDGAIVCPPYRLKVDGKNGPATRRAVRAFQVAYVGTGARRWVLPRDGKAPVGSRTWRAIRWSARNQGLVSAHYRLVEFACNDLADPEVFPERSCVEMVQGIRYAEGHPIPIISATRTEAHNARVGGASSSQHLPGRARNADDEGSRAVDLSSSHRITESEARNKGAKGVGVDGATRYVEHADTRTTGSASWVYS